MDPQRNALGWNGKPKFMPTHTNKGARSKKEAASSVRRPCSWRTRWQDAHTKTALTPLTKINYFDPHTSKTPIILLTMASESEGRPPVSTTKDWSCHGSLGWTLQQALSEMEEEAATQDAINGTAPTSATSPSTSASTIQPTPQMRKAALEALSTGTLRIKNAPHGILKGRIKYYQRQGSRWRFELEDVRLRRRPTLPRNRRKQERLSLWTHSQESRQGKDPPLEDTDKAHKFAFELLAYDDV